MQRESDAARRGGGISSQSGREVQGRDHRLDSRERADLALRPGQLDRPVPRAARALDRQAQGVQADARRRRLLARRFEERDAPAHLRHRLGDEGRPGRVPEDAGGGGEARPPAPRHAARSLPHGGGSARPGVLAPEGLERCGSRSSSTCATSTATTATTRCAARRSSTRSLWERTGHWENYRENMFTTSSENRDYALKPMNCPGHILIYNKGVRSYRDLPLRYGEFGSCHRNEPSGALHGLMRVRGFTQDDGHIFCTEEQILAECVAYTALLQKVYATSASTTSSTRWRRARRSASARTKHGTAPRRRCKTALREVRRELLGCRRATAPSTGRRSSTPEGRHRPVWQCGTMQVDFSMPGRLGAEYVGDDNTRQTPVMLHRAIVGSMERFIGILIEHYARRLPALARAGAGGGAEHHRAPGRVRRRVVKNQLVNHGFRAISDLRNEKISYKIREHSLQKLPYQLVVGDKEKQAGNGGRAHAQRRRSRGDDPGGLHRAPPSRGESAYGTATFFDAPKELFTHRTREIAAHQPGDHRPGGAAGGGKR